MRVVQVLTGECFCGQVQYEVEGNIFDARCCHCSRCRKAFSGAGSAYGLVNPKEFRWLAGEALLSSYSSQANAGLQFCRVCGSTLCGMLEGEIHGVTLGSLNDDPAVSINRHIFVGSKACWDMIGGNAPQYNEYPE